MLAASRLAGALPSARSRRVWRLNQPSRHPNSLVLALLTQMTICRARLVTLWNSLRSSANFGQRNCRRRSARPSQPTAATSGSRLTNRTLSFLQHRRVMSAKLLKFASSEKIPVTARGGGYGYVGGCVPARGGIALSLSPMNRINANQLRRRSCDC